MMHSLLPMLAALAIWQPAQDLTVSAVGQNPDPNIDAQPTSDDSCLCFGNLNANDLVDSEDLGLALGYWGSCPSGDTP